MQKPTVFISHSSLDKDLILQINGLVKERTSGTVDIFQSSDGESIPFGNNWIHQVEKNLNNSKIMLVFVSPRSTLSSWIYFEAGFAYSKGVKVIPIGVDGVDIGTLKPPLNLLQGFNIASAEGLNNIIAVLNREFNCSYPESFTDEDYKRLLAFSFDRQEVRNEVLNIVDHIKILFPNRMKQSDVDVFINKDPLAQVEKLLIDSGVEFRFSGKRIIHTHGAIISYKDGEVVDAGISLVLDPFCLKLNETLINNLISQLYPFNSVGKHWVNVFFEEDASLLTKDFKVSSKLHIHGFSMSDLNGRMHKYQSIDFAIDPSPNKRDPNYGYERENLRVVYDSGHFDTKLLYSLIEELISAGIVEPTKKL